MNAHHVWIGACLAWALLSLPLCTAKAADLDSAPAGNGVRISDLWSLAPISRPTVPLVTQTNWPTNEIDDFILAGLESHGWQPAPPLARDKLIRRVFFDLLGLPPTPADVEEFLADSTPGAYERLVDRLLASPRYGERWARYWLDLVRFAETNGYERDALKPHAWKYRDWVIDALNQDLPYDRFILEQLAGDEMPGANPETLIGTGFLRVGTFDDEPNDPLQYKFEQLDDLVHATSTAFLAITLKCARCHDHKFDPIPQTDYYAFLNFFIAGRASEGDVLGYTDSGRDAPPVKLLKGGDPRQEDSEVAPGFPCLVPALVRTLDPPEPTATTTTRRTQLARWLCAPENPLTARVMVNRLWQHHFGEGLVRSPDNFGMLGAAPTHPTLLDWLASEFRDSGWQLKRLHKLILLSSTYRMDSIHPHAAEYANQDSGNERWWRANRRRLEAEALRDSMLFVSGEINLAARGPSFFPSVSQDALEGLSKKGAAWGQSSEIERRRRSIYMYTQRSLLLPLMTIFDFADTTLPCAQRNVTTVAPQALALLNNDFVHAQSQQFALRVTREAPADASARVDLAWRLALGRGPSASEQALALEHLQRQQTRFAARADVDASQAEPLALASLCHVLLNLNEFLYVD